MPRRSSLRRKLLSVRLMADMIRHRGSREALPCHWQCSRTPVAYRGLLELAAPGAPDGENLLGGGGRKAVILKRATLYGLIGCDRDEVVPCTAVAAAIRAFEQTRRSQLVTEAHGHTTGKRSVGDLRGQAGAPSNAELQRRVRPNVIQERDVVAAERREPCKQRGS